jgi:sigma-54 dependent transcriptional regulator, acetoin dehydrogenase operon transcriptional activator AcoR
MHVDAREHIATVMHVAEHGSHTARATHHDEIIRASWERCVHVHRLDPTRPQDAIILPSNQLREHQDRMEDFLHIARHGLETLYQQVAGLGYCVLLTDARGVTVDFLGDLVFEPSLRKAGLYLGADWSEEQAGTCGVGTCIATGEALTVHLNDHFDATHIPLTCTTAPVFNAVGDLMAVLDVSQLSSSQPKASQHLALQLVKSYAAHIENASFLRAFRREWVLKLSPAPQFLDVNPEYLIAVDAMGRIVGHNRRAQLLLQGRFNVSVIGTSLEKHFNIKLSDLGRFTALNPSDQRAITLTNGGRLLFVLASPPATRITAVSGVSEATRRIPEPLARLSGGDPDLDRQIERAAKLVNTPVSVLLTGETGTGKEYFAKALHESSERRKQPFIAVNCAAIPETLIESELFGHLPGSFSGAGSKGKMGLIQAADGGTLFLDEIGDMPLILQARLLRVLAEREVLAIGATKPVPVNIRVIAATHCNLEQRVRDGLFRDDLFYRLAGARILLPELRKRKDVPWLIEKMLASGLREGERPPRLSPTALGVLLSYSWPGNLRELRNTLDFASAVCSDGHIEVFDLPDSVLAMSGSAPALVSTPPVAERAQGREYGSPAESSPVQPPQVASSNQNGWARNESKVAAADAALLMQYLRAAQWNVTSVARQIGVSRMTLYRRMKRYGIELPQGAPVDD